MRGFSCPQHLLWLLSLFLKIVNKIIKTEMWYNCVVMVMHEQTYTPCSVTLQISLRRRTGSESCYVRPISLHDLSFRAQKSPLATRGRRINNQKLNSPRNLQQLHVIGNLSMHLGFCSVSSKTEVKQTPWKQTLSQFWFVCVLVLMNHSYTTQSIQYS